MITHEYLVSLIRVAGESGSKFRFKSPPQPRGFLSRAGASLLPEKAPSGRKKGSFLGRVISVSNQKGGVGKTTTTVNLAASLAVGENKVLVIDFDPQGNATSALGIDKKKLPERSTVYQALIGEKSIEEIMQPTEVDTLFVAPADENLTGAEIELVSEFAREYRLKNALQSVRDKFDFIFIDSPPSLGLLTVNALTAADGVLVPLQSEYFALEGLSQLMQTIGLVKRSLNPELSIEGIVLTMVSGNKLAGEVEKEVRAHFGDRVFETLIPRNVRLSECSSFGKPILFYDVHSKGCTAYLSLAKEVIARNRPTKVIPPPFVVEAAKEQELSQSG